MLAWNAGQNFLSRMREDSKSEKACGNLEMPKGDAGSGKQDRREGDRRRPCWAGQLAGGQPGGRGGEKGVEGNQRSREANQSNSKHDPSIATLRWLNSKGQDRTTDLTSP